MDAIHFFFNSVVQGRLTMIFLSKKRVGNNVFIITSCYTMYSVVRQCVL